MSRNVELAYDSGYLACIKDVKSLIKSLEKDYDKAIDIDHLKAEIKELHEKYLAFTKST